ncbi:MAG: hypothetical protein KF784_17525 [Fimbriimonadaceae bacterium]|nr:hypothetical protein [Fimbriimonadaceae bacterium]
MALSQMVNTSIYKPFVQDEIVAHLLAVALDKHEQNVPLHMLDAKLLEDRRQEGGDSNGSSPDSKHLSGTWSPAHAQTIAAYTSAGRNGRTVATKKITLLCGWYRVKDEENFYLKRSAGLRSV